MLSRERPTLSDERGSVVVFVAGSLLVLAFMAAFVVDVGNWFVHKRHLQTQVDAAALAGAGEFQACFNGEGYGVIFREATRYAGAPGSFGDETYGTQQYNAQVGGTSDRVTVRFQDRFWANGAEDTDPPLGVDPCTPPYVLDVKATEMPPPFFFPFIEDRVFDADSGINARARVQLRAITSAEPSMPLAVPDVNPRRVGVTFVDERTQQELTGCTSSNPLVQPIAGTSCSFHLAKGATENGLTPWSAPAAVNVPAAPTEIGARIGIGSTVGSCAGRTEGDGFACFASPGIWQGLAVIRGFNPATPATPTAPQLRAVWPTTACATSPFFSDVSLPAGVSSCGAGVSAVVDFGAGANPALQGVDATVKRAGGAGGGTTVALTRGADGVWRSAVDTFTIPVDAGQYDVLIDWSYDKQKGSFNGGKGVTRIYSASEDGSGPVEALTLSNLYLETGRHDVTVSVWLRGTLKVATACDNGTSGAGYNCPTDRPVLLRFASASGSQNYAVNCGTVPGGTGGDFYQQIRYGCADSLSINQAQFCPDPANPDPTSCAPIGNFTGDMVGQLRQAMDDRFAPGGVCTPNNYPSSGTADPRVVVLIVTNFDEFGGSGGSGPGVPVVTYAAFYVTGWYESASACGGVNEPPPPGAAKGNAWGHFIKYVVLGGNPGGGVCRPDVNPCTPVMTK